MKLYNYWISFKRKKDGLKDRTDHERNSWRTDVEEVKNLLERDIDWCNSGDRFIVADSWGIEEKESSQVILIGELGDNDQSYEDFEITVGGKTLYDELYRKYRGNLVKLTMEIIDPKLI